MLSAPQHPGWGFRALRGAGAALARGAAAGTPLDAGMSITESSQEQPRCGGSSQVLAVSAWRLKPGSAFVVVRDIVGVQLVGGFPLFLKGTGNRRHGSSRPARAKPLPALDAWETQRWGVWTGAWPRGVKLGAPSRCRGPLSASCMLLPGCEHWGWGGAGDGVCGSLGIVNYSCHGTQRS